MSTTVSEPHQSALTRPQRRDRTARALAARSRTRSESRRRALTEYVVRINMGVAESIAGRYTRRGIDNDDLRQVAFTALIRAARDFDTSQHDDFLSYAVPTIRGELKKHFRDHGWTVRPPRRIQEAQAQISRAEEHLIQSLGRAPRPSEIAFHLDLPLEEIIEALSADGCYRAASLDGSAAGQGGATTIGDLLGEPDAAQPAAEARAVLAPVVRRLKERDRRILYLRFYEERTQQQIGDELGITQMQVSRLLTRILRDLRTGLGQPEPAA